MAMTGRSKGGLHSILLGAAFILTGSLIMSSSTVEAAGFVAGVEPHQRRADIPVITDQKRDAAWQKRALSGVSKPYPEHVLQFLDDQGEWYSPFIHPGMVDRYDIRGWHKKNRK